MGIIKDVWNKTRFAKEAEEKAKQKQFEDEISQEVQQEVRQKAKEQLKEKIIQQEVDKIVNPKPKSNFLAKLGEEFKGSGVGSTEQLNKLMGKNPNQAQNPQNIGNTGGLSNEGIMSAFGSKSLKTDQNTGNLLGGEVNLQRNSKDYFGIQNKKEKDVVGVPDTSKQLNKMLGKK